MSLELEYKRLLKLVRTEGKKDYKKLAKAIRMPYSTLLVLSKGDSPGAVRSWLRIERYFLRNPKDLKI